MASAVPSSVSVVIPTTGRRASLLASVDSAREQPETAEVLVVYNGGAGDPDLLARCADRDGVVVIDAGATHGCGPSRQVGVEHARAPWVAFLDDDDLWLPGKLARQLAACRPGVRLVISRSVWRLADRDKVMPQRVPAPGESLADFVFVVGAGGRHGLFWPPALLLEATLLAEVPWWTPELDPALDRHEDMQWAARASDHLGPGTWVLLDSVDAIGERTSTDSMVHLARQSQAVAATEARWLDLLGPVLSPAAERSYRLTHVWPYASRPGRGAVVDALRSPWAAAVGVHRRRSWRRAQSDS